MPYTYKAARVRGRLSSSVWEDIDASNMAIDDLLTDYSKVYLTLRHPLIDHDLFLLLSDAQEMIPNKIPSYKVNEWLAMIGDRTLPTMDKMPDPYYGKLRYNDAFRAGYGIQPTVSTMHHDSDLPTSAKPDLMLTKAGVDYQEMHKFCLASVNGMFHPTAAGPDGFYILDGARQSRIANESIVGLYNFKQLGEIEIIPITADMLYKTHPRQEYKTAVNLQIPKSTSGKAVLMVIGGYLHILDNSYKQVGDGLIKIDFANLPWLERYYESRKLLDLSMLNFSESSVNVDQLTLEDLYSEENIIAYMTMANSFVVLVDTEQLYIDRHFVEKTGLNGRYISHINPDMPLFGGIGRVYEYWPVEEDGDYVLQTLDNTVDMFNARTTNWKSQTSIDNTRYTKNQFFFSKAFFLEVGRIE